ncbi:MAG: group II intron reverse transcriptase/maturase [Alphaproteobacteria bacterium]|nr:group II intron reverse transcriptase/maturase [Alphaproteobacteria bacterium]
MGSKRQNNQLELDFGEAIRSKAPNRLARGTEDPMARPAAEGSTASPEVAGGLMEAIVARDNLKKALAQVKRNKGAPGVDGMTAEELTPYLKEHWPAIRAQLLDGTYRPPPVRRVEIPKPAGGTRALGIPTVLDRFLQQAVLQVLQSQWDATFSPSSYGFRPERSAHQAVVRAQQYIAAGRRWVVDIDLEKFFDRVNHDLLMGLVAKRVGDQRVRRLIRGYLTAGVLADGLVGPTAEGTPQGGPLSPLLSNLMLDVLDKELERRGHCFVRYADDCNIYVQSRRAGERVMASVEQFLTRRLKLKVNTAKSAVARPNARKFLGFSFTSETAPRRRIAPQALARFARRVRALTRRQSGRSLEQTIDQLSVYLTGWRGYFGFCQTASVLRDLDGWVRRRLRCLAWAQWRSGRRRYRALRHHGLSILLAATTAAAARAHGPWRLSRHPALQAALPTTFFAAHGLPTLAPAAA